MALNYKNNPPKDDFMSDVMELLNDEALFGKDSEELLS